MLLNITGSTNLRLFEVNEAAAIIEQAADPEVNLIFGAVIDETLQDEVRVTVIATGFDQRSARSVQVGGNEGKKERVGQVPDFSLDVPVFMHKR